MDIKQLDLGIIISTLGYESLYKTIDSIMKFKGNYNIEILVLGKLKPEMRKRLEKNKLIRFFLVNFKEGDLSHKRNLGMKESRAEIVAHIDDDVVLTANWFEEGLKVFKDKKIGIVSGPGKIPRKEASFLTRLFGNTLASFGAGGNVRKRYSGEGKSVLDWEGDKIIGCNMMMRRELLEKVGGFDPEIIPGEEIDFTKRTIIKGYKVSYEPTFFLIHYARSNPIKFAKQIFGFGRARVALIRRKAQKFSLLYLLPLFAIILGPIFVLGSLFSSLVLKVVLIGFGMYLLFVLFSALYSIIRNKWIGGIFLFLTIPFMHTAYGIGELSGIIFGEKNGSTN